MTKSILEETVSSASFHFQPQPIIERNQRRAETQAGADAGTMEEKYLEASSHCAHLLLLS